MQAKGRIKGKVEEERRRRTGNEQQLVPLPLHPLPLPPLLPPAFLPRPAAPPITPLQHNCSLQGILFPSSPQIGSPLSQPPLQVPRPCPPQTTHHAAGGNVRPLPIMAAVAVEGCSARLHEGVQVIPSREDSNACTTGFAIAALLAWTGSSHIVTVLANMFASPESCPGHANSQHGALIK